MDQVNRGKVDYLQSGKSLPFVIQPNVAHLDLAQWAKANRPRLQTLLLKHGGILFRNFSPDGVVGFEKFIQAISGEPMDYQDRAAPRRAVKNKIYTATDYPPSHNIYLHNESSFAYKWPLKIFFYCMTASEQGGETPLADVRNVFERISVTTRETFEQKKVMYVRNLEKGLFGLPWQTVFQTEDKAVMEHYCREAGIQIDWKASDTPRTRQVRPAIARHPQTKEQVWFNHIAVMHISTLKKELRDTLLEMFKEEDLPTNVYYGDHSPIKNSILDEIRNAYQMETVVFRWQDGDVLMLDNMLTAHGRRPFVGSRKVVVGMTEPVGWGDLE